MLAQLDLCTSEQRVQVWNLHWHSDIGRASASKQYVFGVVPETQNWTETENQAEARLLPQSGLSVAWSPRLPQAVSRREVSRSCRYHNFISRYSWSRASPSNYVTAIEAATSFSKIYHFWRGVYEMSDPTPWILNNDQVCPGSGLLSVLHGLIGLRRPSGSGQWLMPREMRGERWTLQRSERERCARVKRWMEKSGQISRPRYSSGNAIAKTDEKFPWYLFRKLQWPATPSLLNSM